MSFSSTTMKMPLYTGNGVTTVFPYTFKVFTQTDLTVIKRLIASPFTETPLTITTDYTVDGVGDDDGGDVTLLVALPATHKLLIKRAPPRTQTTAIKNQGSYFAKTHEDRMDYITMLIQELNEQLTRAPKLPPTTIQGPLELPEGDDAAALLGYNSDNELVKYALASLAEAVIQQGNAAIAEGATDVVVAFDQAFDDNTYSLPMPSLVNTADASPQYLSLMITAKSAAGFTVSFNGVAVDSGNYVLSWAAMKGT